mmetsp:Transcript_8055/g.12023  ORF Transcript_8055/g.12023 Transcript_8055/m.12023 type:complete len:80 (-) Transcript_8055:956-1195(-)
MLKYIHNRNRKDNLHDSNNNSSSNHNNNNNNHNNNHNEITNADAECISQNPPKRKRNDSHLRSIKNSKRSSKDVTISMG